VGKGVPVKVLRRGTEQILDVTLGRLEVGEQMIADARNARPVEPSQPGPLEEPAVATPTLSDLVGFEVAPLDEASRTEFAIAEEVEGVVVTTVTDGTDAYDKGFLPGLVIVEVNQQEIASVDEVNEIVGAAKEAGRPAVLFKVTDPTGASRFIAVRLG
jgi:serine protease Do